MIPESGMVNQHIQENKAAVGVVFDQIMRRVCNTDSTDEKNRQSVKARAVSCKYGSTSENKPTVAARMSKSFASRDKSKPLTILHVKPEGFLYLIYCLAPENTIF